MRFLNNVKTAFLLGSMMGLCLLIGHLIAPGPRGLLLGFLFGGVGNIFAYFFSDKIALMSMGARQIGRDDVPWLFDMVESLAQRAGLPMPRLYVCPQAAPNAFATGRGPRHAAVAISEGMLRSFPPHEIEGVMAHELAHVKHRDMLISTLAATMAGVIAQLPYVLFWFGGGGSDRRESPLAGIGAILMLILAPIAAMLIQLAISRQREYAADSFGGELCGDPLKLAAALQRLHSQNERIPTHTNPAYHNLYIVEPLTATKRIGALFSTHPPIEKRVALLERQARQFR